MIKNRQIPPKLNSHHAGVKKKIRKRRNYEENKTNDIYNEN